MQTRSEGLFRFHNYREFLSEHFHRAHLRNPRFTFGAWAKTLGMQSTSSLTKILKGERDPGPDVVDKFIRYFKFVDKEARYFRSLILSDRKGSHKAVKGLLSQQMAKLRGRAEIFLVEREGISFFSRWYYPAVYEAIKVIGNHFSADNLSQHFKFKVTTSQIREALSQLTRIGFIEAIPGGYRFAHRDLESKSDIPRETIRNHHKETLAQTIEAIEKIPFHERELSNVTLVIPAERYQEATQAISDFKNEFVERFGSLEGKVMRFQMQLLPLTEELTEKKES